MLPNAARSLVAALAAALALPAHADVVACGGGVPSTVICLTGDVSDVAGGGPLVTGQVYHLAGFVNVPNLQTLTVEPGAILKFHPSAVMEVRGRLVSGAGAVFTSLRDDTAGGDTNGDGGASVPMRGDWDGIIGYGNADATLIEGTEVRYAVTGLDLRQADVTLNGVTVRECSRSALDLGGSSYPTVQGCTFTRNEFAVEGVPIEALPGFADNAASENTRGDYLHVSETTITADLAFGPGNSLSGEPFVLCRQVDVPAGLTLRLEGGTVLKLGAGPFPPHFGCGLEGFVVRGTLLAEGVTITSLEDDTVAGDTNRDGNATVPMPGDWGRIVFRPGSDASVMRDCLLRYGGFTTTVPFAGPTLTLDQADVLLERVTVEDGRAAALRLSSNSFPTVRECAFHRHPGVAVERVPLGAVAGFADNVAEDNGGDYLELLGAGPATVTGLVTIPAASALNGDGLFVVADDVAVASGGELVLGAGVVIKWTVPDNHRLTVAGILRTGGGAPVVLTSMRDDAVLGDTNGDGAASAPAPGDWTGIRFLGGSDASVLEGLVVRYAGNSAQATGAIELVGASPTIRDSEVRFSQGAGLASSFESFPAIEGCLFADGQRAVVGVPISALPGYLDNAASGNALGDYLLVTDGEVSAGGSPGPCALTIGPANALAPDHVLVVDDDVDVPAGCLLSMLGGTLVKWIGLRELDVDGSVQLGSLGGGVVLTSIDDDSVGGDTRKDGATEGAPGDWSGIDLSAAGSVLQDVLVRFAGGTAKAAVRITGADAQLQGVRVEDAARAALDLVSTSTPIVHGCAFERNLFAVEGVPLRALPGFDGNTASENATGDFLRVTSGLVALDQLVRPSQSLNGGPIVLAADVVVPAGVELVFEPGVTLKFQGIRALDVQGTLRTMGPAGGVILTTFADDIAGDTNKDGGASAPSPGSWTGLLFGPDSDASVLAGARVRFAGASGQPALRLQGADVTIVDTAIESSGGAGLHLSNSARPSVLRSSITDGLGWPVDFAPLAAVPGFLDVSASGNGPSDHMRVRSAAFDGSLVIERASTLNRDGVLVVDTSVTVDPGELLELRQGMVLKWMGFNRNLSVGGTLVAEGTGLEPVVLTSVHDDEVGGDALKDGLATLPAPGDWGTLTLGSGASGSRLEHLGARYGGRTLASISLAEPGASARALRVDHSGADGIHASQHAGDAAGWVAFACAGDGIELTGGAFDLVHATVTACAGPGVRRGSGHQGTLRNSIAWGNASPNLVGFALGEVFASDVDALFDGIDGNLSLDPLFVDALAGELDLAPTSPCVDSAERASALATVLDHREASRILDDDLDGTAEADMGAFERAAFALSFAGEPRIGTTMGFTVDGQAPGLAIFFLGTGAGASFVDPLGFTLYGPLGSGQILGSAPVGDPLSLEIPPAPGVVGSLVAVQALAMPSTGAPAPGPLVARPPVSRERGNYTNRYRGRILP